MAIVVDVISPVEVTGTVQGQATAVTVVVGSSTPVTTNTQETSVVELALPGGTVANVQWGEEFPASPYEGQIFLRVTP